VRAILFEGFDCSALQWNLNSEDLVTVEEDFNSRECAKLMVWMVAHILPL
jgi:hypothetical protein